MKQTIDLKGATIQAVEVLSEDDAVVYNGQHGAYEIVILTDKGSLIIAGCNDSGPDVDMIERSDKAVIDLVSET